MITFTRYAVLWRSVGTPLIQSERSARGAKQEVEKTLKFARPNWILARGSHPTPWPSWLKVDHNIVTQYPLFIPIWIMWWVVSWCQSKWTMFNIQYHTLHLPISICITLPAMWLCDNYYHFDYSRIIIIVFMWQLSLLLWLCDNAGYEDKFVVFVHSIH